MVGRLTIARIKTLTKPGRYGDGDGPWLQVRNANSRSWFLRYKVAGRERQMGLGEFPVITLADARDAALAARRQLAHGTDPIDARKAEREAKQREAAAAVTFKQVADLYVKAHQAGWRNAKQQTRTQVVPPGVV